MFTSNNPRPSLLYFALLPDADVRKLISKLANTLFHCWACWLRVSFITSACRGRKNLFEHNQALLHRRRVGETLGPLCISTKDTLCAHRHNLAMCYRSCQLKKTSVRVDLLEGAKLAAMNAFSSTGFSFSMRNFVQSKKECRREYVVGS